MIEFLVEGMTCSHCVRHVTTAVHSVAPDAQVAVDLDSKAVNVQGSSDRERIADAIREAGYTPVPA